MRHVALEPGGSSQHYLAASQPRRERRPVLTAVSDTRYPTAYARMLSAVKAERVAAVARRTFRHPRWAAVGLRQVLLRRFARRDFTPEQHPEYLTRPGPAVAEALGVPLEQVRAEVEATWWPEAGDWGAGDDLTRTLRAIIRLRRPKVVVEAGVATGVSTAVILYALEENGSGELHSVDLPLVGKEDQVGLAVPTFLRARWSLYLGPARSLLPRLFERVAPVDVFVHDADHAYPSQLRELRLAWPYLKPRGVIVSDDVVNPAFIDFAHEVGVRPWLIHQKGHNGAVGLAVKPGEAAV